MTPKDKALEWLRTFMDRVNHQDNRGTATPYYYQIRKPVRQYGIADGFETGWEWKTLYDHDTLDEDEIRDRLWELLSEKDEDLLAAMAADEIEHEDVKDFTPDDFELLADAIGIEKVNYRDVHEKEGFFLTEKAVAQHIEENQHNLPKGTDTYLDHAYRNPELKNLLTAVGILVGIAYERK